MPRTLTDTADLPDDVARPAYRPDAHGVGIVHIGPGAFFKAHQAVYTDDALAAEGGDWRVAAYSLRRTTAADEMGPQNGLYTLLERDAAGTRARVIGAVAEVGALSRDRARIAARLAAPETRIVTLTVTERGYGLDRATGELDRTHPAIAADLATPETPIGVAGLLVQALAARRAHGTPPFAVLSCDNLSENGALVRRLLTAVAEEAAPEMAAFIAEHVPCPSAMVDRITPARSAATLADAQRLTGRRDVAAEETESFHQWVIEDRFPSGRPAWEAGGATLVGDVRPYEMMKLRMLNGTHSLIAYAGSLAGHRYVRDAMHDADLARRIRAHLDAAAATLPPVPGIDLAAYRDALLDRFANPALAHETAQIAKDGTEKLPQRIFAPALDALQAGAPIASFAYVTAAWLGFVLDRCRRNAGSGLHDPRADALCELVAGQNTAEDIVSAVSSRLAIVPTPLASHPAWIVGVASALRDIVARRGLA